MIFSDDEFLDNLISDEVSLDDAFEDPEDEAPADDPEEEEVEDEPVRSQYDGDVSDSILAKLGSYYNAHSGLKDSYSIYRPSQYTYVLVYGDSDDGRTFSNPTVVTLTTSSYSSSGSSLSVSYPSSYTVDTSWSGYVYSSFPSFVPNHYILDSPRYLNSSILIITVVVFVVVLCRLSYSVIKKR